MTFFHARQCKLCSVMACQSKILSCELLPHLYRFELWYTYWPIIVDMCDTFFIYTNELSAILQPLLAKPYDTTSSTSLNYGFETWSARIPTCVDALMHSLFSFFSDSSVLLRYWSHSVIAVVNTACSTCVFCFHWQAKLLSHTTNLRLI